MIIGINAVVSIDYTLRNPEGQILDSSSGRDPLVYLHGTGALIPGLERELDGKKKGEQLNAVVQPADAYGVRRKELLMPVKRSGFQGTEEITVGMQVEVNSPEGHRIARISEINGDEVILDLNHPLADVILHFELTIADVRIATKDEIAHGHVHGAGGHHH